jgi:hypothetical protein
MLNKSLQRAFSSSSKNVCILANSRQSDLIGSKVMSGLRTVAGDNEINFFGQGGAWMQKEGFNNTFEVDFDSLMDKQFHTFRRSKVTMGESLNHKWNPFNLINKHFSRHSEQVYDTMIDNNLPKRIYQSRPDLILNIGNEYLAQLMMEELASKLLCLLHFTILSF